MSEFTAKKRDDFWDEICGTHAFKELGLKEINPASLQMFDKWYMEDTYPYLSKYLPFSALGDKNVLEIGLGFGTIGQRLLLSAREYTGVDFAKNPVELMNYRVTLLGKGSVARALCGDARKLPFNDRSFDLAVSIGCLHHTGDIPKSIKEIHRVLKPSGKAVVMLYNKNSFRRRVTTPLRYLVLKAIGRFKFGNYSEYDRAIHDSDSEGKSAPITEFINKKDIRNIFAGFRRVSIEKENFDDLYIPKTKLGIPRKYLLNNIAKLWGADFYITGIK
jgi:ubiquinone/menaquinone biosynthesis C-methylase UbiE